MRGHQIDSTPKAADLASSDLGESMATCSVLENPQRYILHATVIVHCLCRNRYHVHSKWPSKEWTVNWRIRVSSALWILFKHSHARYQMYSKAMENPVAVTCIAFVSANRIEWFNGQCVTNTNCRCTWVKSAQFLCATTGRWDSKKDRQGLGWQSTCQLWGHDKAEQTTGV